MKECEAVDVPSQYALCQVQANLQEASGNVLYVNSLPEIVAKDYANPQTAHLLQHYPEDTKGPVSEIWQARRWKELPPDLLTPMCRHKMKDYYVNELAETRAGKYVIPYMWIIRESQTFLERMPNPLRAIAKGEELYTSFVFLWEDDIGGNTSKVISAHKNIYLAHTNLPGQLVQQEYFVHFVSTSPEATTPEQFEAVKEVILETQQCPPRVFHAHTQQMCKFRLVLPGLPADNPQQLEEASHIGPSGNCKCRCCFVGGPPGVRESDEGYHALHELDKAMDGSLAPISVMQTASGTKDWVTQGWILKIIAKVKELKQRNPGRSLESIRAETKVWLNNQAGHLWSPLLTIPGMLTRPRGPTFYSTGPPLTGLDPHRDTPVEILHTVLLGSVKYIWHSLHTSINDIQREQFITQLQYTDIHGLSVSPIRASYMSQHRNGLVGKHFKTLMQTLVFHVHGIVPNAMFKLINTMGRLGAVLWYHSIPHMKESLGDLRILIVNVLDAFDLVDPARILEKGKLHILTHLVEDVEHFGPAIRYATEVFECFNHVFRMCSVLSNHQSPGHDIAHKCTSLEHDGQWTQAAPRVRSIIKQHAIIQTHLGWALLPTWQPGSTWYDATSVRAQSGDLCQSGTWVCIEGNTNETLLLGHITHLLLPQERTSHGCVFLNRFNISDSMHPYYEMPFLTRSEHEQRAIVQPKDRSLVYFLEPHRLTSRQHHDCHSGECTLSGCQFRHQEREVTEHTVPVLVHADDAHFIINLHALHNATPTPLHVDSKAFHYEMATKLRVTQEQKRKNSAAKSKATCIANKLKKQMAQIERIADTSISTDAVETDGAL
ncbi:hypothetical protein JB92DRAFT_3084667 [Gautieria morchelliformis]|nr:hypothetical protein JB92DRAFT_3084667 [Gautieria morchelliformis]